MQDLVPDLDTCRRLKAAGFPQDTALAWWQTYLQNLYVADRGKGYDVRLCAAPTLEELLRALPDAIRLGEDHGYLTVDREEAAGESPGFCAAYLDLDGNDPWKDLSFGPNERAAQAAADLYLALSKSGLMPNNNND